MGHFVLSPIERKRWDRRTSRGEEKREPWPQGYKTFFMLNSVAHEIFPANKSQITNNCKFLLVKVGNI